MTSADDFVLQIIEEKGLVSAEIIAAIRDELTAADVSAADIDSKIIDTLVDKRICKYDDIALRLAQEFNIPFMALHNLHVDEDVKRAVPEDIARKYGVFPIAVENGQMEMAISDPMDMDMVDNLSHLLGMPIDLRLSTPDDIKRAIDDLYGVKAYGDMFDGVDAGTSESGAIGLATGNEEGVSEEEAPIIRYVHKLITEAVKRRASDIHLEPLEKRFRVRYRIDGVLIEVENPPKRLQPSIISRLKLMANISIAEKRVPQDGRIQIVYNNKEIDLRVSSLPTVYGESIVMRILDKEGLRLGLPELGFFSDDQSVFERVVSMADGIFLVTGPTGSGKSTTLAAVLNRINHTRAEHIITLEDPVEYIYTPDKCVINQREIGRDTRNYADGLRAILREDPDIILIGEMRDLDTIEAALTAAETGHLVFATLHTNSAADSIDRIVGVFPDGRQKQIRMQLSTTLRVVLSQQLVPKTSGGRVAACEVMVVNDAIRNIIREGKTPQIENFIAMNQQGGSILMDNALMKLAAEGKISREEAAKRSKNMAETTNF